MSWAEYCRWRPAFEDVLDKRYYTIEWLDTQILSGAAFFMSTPEAAIVYELKSYPTGARDIHGLIAAGTLSDIKDVLIPGACARARSLGCIAALIESRPGWARELRNGGFETHQVSIRKEL